MHLAVIVCFSRIRLHSKVAVDATAFAHSQISKEGWGAKQTSKQLRIKDDVMWWVTTTVKHDPGLYLLLVDQLVLLYNQTSYQGLVFAQHMLCIYYQMDFKKKKTFKLCHVARGASAHPSHRCSMKVQEES